MSCNKKTCGMCTIIALVVILAANIVMLCTKTPLSLETLKVWWSENMAKIQQVYEMDAYKTSQSEAIDQTLAQIWLTDDQWDLWEWETNNEWNTNNNESIMSAVEDILASAPVRGEKDARFTILEYSELLCPYCQRQSANGTIDAVIENFNGEVNSVFRHYIVHGESALALAAVMECVAELKADVYYDVLEKAFAARSEWNLQDTTALVDLAANNWVNKSKLQSCVDEWKYRDAVTTMASQWASLFGVSWTPGNVIIDRETGKFVLIPGAYPAESLIEQINAMKAE